MSAAGGRLLRSFSSASPPPPLSPFFPSLSLFSYHRIHPSISVHCFAVLSFSSIAPLESLVSSDICFHAWPACSSLLLLLCLSQLCSFKGRWVMFPLSCYFVFEPSIPIFPSKSQGVLAWLGTVSHSASLHLSHKLAILL